MNYKLLGDEIRKQRKARGYTLEQLAEILDVSTTFIGQIERAKGVPSLETLVKISNALEVSADSLLFGSLNSKAGDAHFMGRVAALTEGFSEKEKELLLQSIEIFCQMQKEK